MKLSPVGYWFSEATTIFVNGALAGVGAGSAVGGSAGLGLHFLPKPPENLSASESALVFLVTTALTMLANGTKRFVVWHDSHEFPNPFPAPEANPPPAGPIDNPPK